MKKNWPDISLSCTSDPEMRVKLCDALQQEARDWARLRLYALDLLLTGHSIEAAAKQAKVKVTALRHWITIANKSGWPALLQFRYGRRYHQSDLRGKTSADLPAPSPASKKTSERRREETERPDAIHAIRTAALRADIACHLARTLSLRDRERLAAADNVLAGASVDAVAHQYERTPETVRDWMRKLARGGALSLISSMPIEALFSSSLPEPMIEEDPRALRRLAMKECLQPIRRALLALARVAEGRTLTDAAASIRAGNETVLAWLTAYRDGGVASLWRHHHRSPRLFHASRLSPEQKQAIIEVMGPEAVPDAARCRRRPSADAGVTNAMV